MGSLQQMQISTIKTTIDAWSFLSNKIVVPYTEEEYNRLVEVLDDLIYEVGEDESHPLASMMDVIGVLIENYETEHILELEDI